MPLTFNRKLIKVHCSFEEIDIEIAHESRAKCQLTSKPKDCCEQNYLKISSQENEQSYCGEGFKYNKNNVYVSNSNLVTVTFNVTSFRNEARGFYFSYMIAPRHSSHCSADEYRCHNGRCIAKQWICNNRQECVDGSDENFGCESSFNSLYKCGDTDEVEFYDYTKKCDFKFDCANRADELGCFGCSADKFKCSNTNNCIESSRICNGFPDCEDFSDELNCGVCRGNKIRCAHGAGCYEPSERCNGIVQCVDYSDELNCTEQMCRPERGAFLCPGGRCIPSLW